jgi:hypothetical protein
MWRASVIGTLDYSKDENLELASKGIVKAFADYPPKRSNP